ncbi:MAG: von Willebrand factor type A domain-containing protein, partial [Planctomycetota bacterium]|nr:von Willebrand factor type A domain-containing protein [Planctomycetota bacterium]
MRSRLMFLSAAVIAAACDSPPRAKGGPVELQVDAQPASKAGPASPAGPQTDSAFDPNVWNSAIGAGGGAGGRYGGRAGAIRGRPSNTESYAEVPASGFFDADAAPLSTFAADVDSASFTNAGRILNDGERPPVAAIRVEEFVNACRYDLTPPSGRQTFAVEAEVAQCPWNHAHELVRFSLNTRPIDKEKLPPCNFVFLIDVSGSMSSANKLGLFQKASDLLIDQLRPQDRVSIVTYASGVRVPLDSVSGDERGKIRAAIQALRTSGGTNGQGGIQAAYQLAKKNKVQGVNRVLLATDGDFNVGIR